MARPETLKNWIEALPESGRYVFTRAEADAATHASAAAAKMTLYRLKRSGALVSPRRDFFVLVPREYRSAGSPSADWFIDDLMRHLGRNYYVALLSAAALHGAAHQRPMVFQVITDASERAIEVGRVRIQFHLSTRVNQVATKRRNTPTGTMVVATPETTAFDLIRFVSASGGWNNVATVLIELAEQIDPAALATSAQHASRSEVQRLGWLLERIGERDLAGELASALEGKRLLPTPLRSSSKSPDAPLDPRWRVLVNVDVDPDL